MVASDLIDGWMRWLEDGFDPLGGGGCVAAGAQPAAAGARARCVRVRVGERACERVWVGGWLDGGSGL